MVIGNFFKLSRCFCVNINYADDLMTGMVLSNIVVLFLFPA